MNSVIYQFLNEPRRLKNKILIIESEIEDLRTAMLPGAIRYDKDSVMCSPEDKMIEYAIRLELLAAKRDKLMAEYEVAYAEFMVAMSILTDKQGKVLSLKYLDGKSNAQISKELGVDKRNVLRRCDRAYELILNEILTATSRIKYNVL